MPVYVLGPDDPNNLGKISTNLCPYFSSSMATVQVQSVNTMANILILDDDDYIEFGISKSNPEHLTDYKKTMREGNVLTFVPKAPFAWNKKERKDIGIHICLAHM
jgi:hypothetical protein